MTTAADLVVPCGESFDWAAALQFLARRAIAGVEHVDARSYRRTLRLDGVTGVVAIAHDAARHVLVVRTAGWGPGATGTVTALVRNAFDVEADDAAIRAHLSRDPWLAPAVATCANLRVWHGWDGFEVAVRTIVGQQVSVARAQAINAALVARCAGLGAPAGASDVSLAFPSPAQVLDADVSRIGMPSARVATIQRIARALLDDPRLFARSHDVEAIVGRLRRVPGIGDWTAHYIAMRACAHPDAFPASDIGLLRGAADPEGRRPTARALEARAEAWRPWRSYAAQVLWGRDAAAARAG